MSNARKTATTRRAATKRTTARRSAATIANAIDEDGVFDLDALEREGGQQDPFQVRHGEKTFTLPDPAEVDFVKMAKASNDPGGDFIALRELLGDQFDDFVTEGPLPVWKVPLLLDAWHKHYGIPDLGK